MKTVFQYVILICKILLNKLQLFINIKTCSVALVFQEILTISGIIFNFNPFYLH